jgi:hypothetical protein
MSILNNNQSQTTSAEATANMLKSATIQTFKMMVNSFNTGAKTFWNNPHVSPSEIAEALGTDAKEIFELHYALGQLIGNIKPEAINEGLNLIGQFTINKNGTVTIKK